MVLKEIIFNSLYLIGEGVVVLKELIFNILYFGRVQWTLKKSFLTVSW